MNSTRFSTATLGAFLIMGLGHFAMAGTVNLQGGTTWQKRLTPEVIGPVETKCKVKLEVVGTGSARGLKALVDGKTQIALLAGTPKLIIEQMNSKESTSAKEGDFEIVPVTKDTIVVAVNEANTLGSVKSDVAVKLLSGQVKNWKEVGGPDQPVLVVLPSKGEGARLEVESQLMKGAKFADGAREMQTAKDVPVVISQVPGAIGTMPGTHKQAGVKVLDTGAGIDMPLALATKGKASDEQKCVIDAVKAAVK